MTDCIVDACCLINLCATNRLSDILQAQEGSFHVSAEVRCEALSVYQPAADDAERLELTPIDLSSAIQSGLLKECKLDGLAELNAFVEFAIQLNDGEASCLAIAKSRGWRVATDDKKAIRLATAEGISVATTPQIIKKWVDVVVPESGDVVDMLLRIEKFAKFRPHRTNMLFGWWASLTMSA
jgi:predicted nucleic acid-binding protein